MNTPAQDLTGSSIAGGTSDTDQLETLVQIELVGTLARQSRDASLIAPIGFLFLAFLQIGHVPLTSILMWLALVTVPDALTLLRSYKFDRVPRTLAAMRSWQVRQTLIHSLSGLAWGSSILFFVNDATPIEHEMKIVLVLMVVSALAVIPVSTSLASLTGFLIGIALIPLLHYLAGSHPDHLWLALSSLILMGCALHFGRIAHQQIRAHVLSSAINDRLASALSDANLTINATNRELQEKNLALIHALENLNNQATHDELTGLYNRRYILQRLEEQWQDIRRYHTTCSIALLDIDHFKLVNDQYGHGIGDLVLKGFANRIQGELRQGDIFARYGGEEFLLVLPMAELEAAGKLVDRLRQIIEETPVIDEPLTISIRSSFGVAELLPTEVVHDCISRADRALYRAKEGGRNRVELAGKES
jgi:diguanylate cyclase (GGDEF)-like protein